MVEKWRKKLCFERRKKEEKLRKNEIDCRRRH